MKDFCRSCQFSFVFGLCILSFSEKCKNQGSFCKCLIINKVLFLYRTCAWGKIRKRSVFLSAPIFVGKIYLQNSYLSTWVLRSPRLLTANRIRAKRDHDFGAHHCGDYFTTRLSSSQRRCTNWHSTSDVSYPPVEPARHLLHPVSKQTRHINAQMSEQHIMSA